MIGEESICRGVGSVKGTSEKGWGMQRLVSVGKLLSPIGLKGYCGVMTLPMKPLKKGCQIDAIIIDGLSRFQKWKTKADREWGRNAEFFSHHDLWQNFPLIKSKMLPMAREAAKAIQSDQPPEAQREERRLRMDGEKENSQHIHLPSPIDLYHQQWPHFSKILPPDVFIHSFTHSTWIHWLHYEIMGNMKKFKYKNKLYS